MKNELIGTWRLLSYIEVPLGGGDSAFPYGKSPKGLLLYGPDGFMSVQISASEEVKFISGDKMIASNEEVTKRLRSYIAFSGRYIVDNNRGGIIYSIDTCLYPNWEGTKQSRKIDFEGDVLYQKSMEPILSDGKLVHAYMTWKKIEKEDSDDLLKEEIVHFEI
jgi:hypothetical protein